MSQCSTRTEGRIHGAKLFSAAICAILSGCVSSPESQLSKIATPVPDRWAEAESGEAFDPQSWTSDFNDSQLKEIVADALASNHDLKAAEARLAAGRANLLANGSEIWPSLTATAGGSKSRRNPESSGTAQTATNENYSINGRFVWELDLWGRVRNGYKGDIADLEASYADYAATRLSIGARTAQAWYDAIEAQQQLDLAEKILTAFESSQQIVEENFKRGISSALDVRLIRANVAANESALEQRLREKKAAVRNLETLLGRYPKNDIQTASELPEVTGFVPAGLPSELLLRRPDVIAAERRLAASEQRKFESSKARIPSISLTVNRGASSSELDGVFDLVDNRVWSQAIDLTQPIFQGKRLKGNYERAKANYQLALATYQQTILTAFREVENAIANHASFGRDLESQKVAAEESIAAEELAWDEYKRGLVNITTVLDSVRRAITARRSLISTYNEHVQSRIDLYLALGGGFDLPATESTNN